MRGELCGRISIYHTAPISKYNNLRFVHKQVQNTTQQLGQICTEGVGEAKRRLEENRPGIDQFVKNIGDNMQQGVKKVQEVRARVSCFLSAVGSQRVRPVLPRRGGPHDRRTV